MYLSSCREACDFACFALLAAIVFSLIVVRGLALTLTVFLATITGLALDTTLTTVLDLFAVLTAVFVYFVALYALFFCTHCPNPLY